MNQKLVSLEVLESFFKGMEENSGEAAKYFRQQEDILSGLSTQHVGLLLAMALSIPNPVSMIKDRVHTRAICGDLQRRCES